MRSNLICKTGNNITFKTLAGGPSLISMPTQNNRPSRTSWVPKYYEYPLSPQGSTTAPWMSDTTALAALPPPTKPSASRHQATQRIRTRRSIWYPIVFRSIHLGMSPPTAGGGDAPENFLCADCITVSQSPWCSGLPGLASLSPTAVGRWNPACVFDVDVSTSLWISLYCSLHFRLAMLELVLKLILILKKGWSKHIPDTDTNGHHIYIRATPLGHSIR